MVKCRILQIIQECDTNNTEQDQEEGNTNSSDILPAHIRQFSKRPVKRKFITSYNESEHDDSGADQEYVSGKQDMNSSDSESSVLFRKVKKEVT